jgi:hypothetical protein
LLKFNVEQKTAPLLFLKERGAVKLLYRALRYYNPVRDRKISLVDVKLDRDKLIDELDKARTNNEFLLDSEFNFDKFFPLDNQFVKLIFSLMGNKMKRLRGSLLL